MDGTDTRWRAAAAQEYKRVSAELAQRARPLSAATVHEAAGKIGALPCQIKPVHGHFRVCGPAFTVQAPPGDNLWLHRAIYAAQPGDILVVQCGGAYEHGYWGEVMSTAAKARALGGLVIDGGVRDFTLLKEVDFPVFARGRCIRGTGKDRRAIGWINTPTLIGEVIIHPGDLVIGDNDGVVVVPRDRAVDVVLASEKRDAEEADICRRLMAGETTLDIYGLS